MGLFSRGARLESQGSRAIHRPRPGRAARGNRLQVEGLEDRTLLTVFFVEPLSYPSDGSHFHSLQDALGAASAGDTIQIESGAAVHSVSNSVISTAILVNASAVGATSIVSSTPIPTGEVIQIGTGTAIDTALVVATGPAAGGNFTLTLRSPLANAHNAGDLINIPGELGISKTITLQGGSFGGKPSITTPLVVWQGTAGVVFQNLDLSSVTLLSGSSGTQIRNTQLGSLTEAGGGGGNGGNVITLNVITGPVSLTGNPSGSGTGDQITNNQFQGGTLSLTHDDNAVIRGNTFNDVGTVTAIAIPDSQGVAVSGNKIFIANGGSVSNAGAIAVSIGQPTGTTPVGVTLLNNVFNTNNFGRGVFITVPQGHGSNLRVQLQGNDFHFDAIGLEDVGDGTNSTNAAGIIDAGGGVLGSLGGNNFRGFQSGDAAAGTRIAIFLHGTQGTAGTINAVNNLFSSSAPPTALVKDAMHNTSSGGPAVVAGSGTINTGTTQLTADQQFVQALYGQFLGRTGAVPELNVWVNQLPTMGQTGVANAIIHTPEGLARLVDSFYLKYLNRTAESAGESFWVNALQNGMTEEQVIAQFVASGEYYDRLKATSEAPNTAYVISLYNVLLGRTGSNSEVNFWLGQLAAHNGDRTFVALGFTQSAEYRGDIVTGYYYTLLHRTTPPGSGEVASWVNSTMDLSGIAAGISGSGEFYVNG
jgi:hypothetical protein